MQSDNLSLLAIVFFFAWHSVCLGNNEGVQADRREPRNHLMRYFTSDLHLGDKTVARWRGFDDIDAHDALVAAGLATLRADDELWLLGDLCKANLDGVRSLREHIPCSHVHVVVGNHDSRSRFVTSGLFDSVEYYDQVGKVAREGYKFVMSHYPMLDWDRAFHGSYMLHGHIHSLPAEGYPGKEPPLPRGREDGGFGIMGYNEWNREHGIRRYDVGVDANHYLPVSAEQILAFFA